MRDPSPASKLAGNPDDAHEWGAGDGFVAGRDSIAGFASVANG
jgi:hypothetical protein